METNDYFFALQQETIKTADPSKVTEILNTQKGTEHLTLRHMTLGHRTSNLNPDIGLLGL